MDTTRNTTSSSMHIMHTVDELVYELVHYITDVKNLFQV